METSRIMFDHTSEYCGLRGVGVHTKSAMKISFITCSFALGSYTLGQGSAILSLMAIWVVSSFGLL